MSQPEPAPVVRLERPKGDQLPPHDLAAERAVLGAMLLDPAAIDAVTLVLDAGDYYRPAHGLIHDAIVTAAADGPIDPAIVAAQLGPNLDAAGGAAELVTLQTEVPTLSNAGRYAAIVRARADDRRFIAGLVEALDTARHGDVDSALAAAEATVDTRAAVGTGSRLVRVGDHLGQWITDLEDRAERDGPAGIATGWVDLDHRLGGLRGGQLIVVAGRPAMGKTAVAGCLALNAAGAGHTVLVVSIEMSVDELETRFVAAQSHLSALRLRDGVVAPKDWERLAAGVDRLAALPLWVYDDADATLPTIRAHARRTGAQLVIVDYLQLMRASAATRRNETREREVAELSAGLKRMGRELGVPVVALAQLNRQVELRMEKRPQLADLRESGAIENDADVVIGLYRDEYYNPDSDDRGVLELITLKQRAGTTGTDKVAYQADQSLILNFAREA